MTPLLSINLVVLFYCIFLSLFFLFFSLQIIFFSFNFCCLFRYDLFSSAVFLPYFSMFILSLPLLRLGSKSTSLSPGFCVCRPRQYDTICWKSNLISGFFVFSGYLIGQMESINVAGVL